MKRLVAMIIAIATLCAIGIPVSAQYVPVYRCRASSDTAWGIGIAATRDKAAYLALVECARRTPSDRACVVNWCVRDR